MKNESETLVRQQSDAADSNTQAETPQDTRIARKKQFRRREIRGWIISVGAAVIIALLLRFFVFEFIRVEGPSMEPTLYTNEFVFMEKVTYWFSEPSHGDIVIVNFPGRTETFVKRVIGVGGDTVEVRAGVLYVNGQANYDYFDGVMNIDMGLVTVPENSVFVMGDNRNHSMDSTSTSIGALPDDLILGRAVFILWPVDKLGGL